MKTYEVTVVTEVRQTFEKTFQVEAESPQEAREKVRGLNLDCNSCDWEEHGPVRPSHDYVIGEAREVTNEA